MLNKVTRGVDERKGQKAGPRAESYTTPGVHGGTRKGQQMRLRRS